MLRACALVVLLPAFAGRAAAQDPADPGPLITAEWNAGSVSAGGASIPTVVVYPATGGPYPVVGMFHGLAGNGGQHSTLAQTLASYGLVVIRPDMPCGLGGCDHDSNATIISALLEWAVAQSADGASMLSGKIDGERRGLVGHSFGALNSHLAASRDATIDSVVLLDPNDDTGLPGLGAAPGVTAPTAQLLAQVPGSCNGAWNETAITPMLPTPKLQLTVSGSGHCDPADSHVVCEFACGSGDAATNRIFRRYAVAWTVCNLRGDSAMGEWLGGASMAADESGGTLIGVSHGGLAELPCRSGTPPVDAGTPPVADGGPPDVDAGSMPGADAGAHFDAGSSVRGDDGGGCGCTAARADHSIAPASLACLAALAARLLRRRRRAF